jgi:hypothetical protein
VFAEVEESFEHDEMVSVVNWISKFDSPQRRRDTEKGEKAFTAEDAEDGEAKAEPTAEP